MNLTGVFVPLITPFDEEGAVALDALEALAERVLRDGANGLVALGTTGEPGSLTAAEKQAVVEVATRVCREYGATLIVGGNGGDARLSLVPPFVRPGEAGVLEYFRQLESPVPLVIYHVPYRTGQALSAGTLQKLAELPNVAGIKYAAGGIDDETMLFLSGDLPDDFAVLGGDDPFIAPMLALGAHGGILASAHLETPKFVEHGRGLARRRPRDRPRGWGSSCVQLSKALFAEPNPTVIKAVLHARGEIPTPDVRLPLLPAARRHDQAAVRLLPALVEDEEVVPVS